MAVEAVQILYLNRRYHLPFTTVPLRAPPPLDENVLVQVFQEVKDSGNNSLPDLRSLHLVSRQFHRLATPLLYSTIEIHEDNIRPIIILLTRLLANPLQYRHVRAVKMWSPQYGIGAPVIRLLRQLAPELRRLTDLYWAFSSDGGELLFMTELRLYQPNFKLHLLQANVGGHPNRTLLRQAGEYVQTLDAWVPWNASHPVANTALFEALRQCPNLEKLSVVRMDWPEPFLETVFVEFEDTRPLLKELVMHDIIMNPADLMEWGEWGGWQDLEKLTVSDPRDVAYFQGCEDSLRSITMFNPTPVQLTHLLESYRRFANLYELTVMMTNVKQSPLLLWVGDHEVDHLKIHTMDDGSKKFEFHIRIRWGRKNGILSLATVDGM